jgi:CheY-like chemotaxis protein
MSKGTILIVDNKPEHVTFRRQALEDAGYTVREAPTLPEASTEFDTGLIHLAIVDIRMLREEDQNDWSGLEWVDETRKQYPEFPCLILTAYPTYEAVRRALGPRGDLPPAEDFVTKDEPIEALVEKVNRVFAAKVKINPDLDIEFGGPTSCLCIASIIELEREGLPSPAETGRFVSRAQEIHDLLCKMFSARQRIVVYPMLGGRTRTAVLAVKPFSGGRTGRLVVAKLGKKEDIKTEAQNYHEHASAHKGAWAPTKEGPDKEPTAGTLHFGGLVYTVVGGELERTERFRDFYRGHTADQISEILGLLFRDLCSHWYSPRAREESESLTAALRRELELTPEHHSRERFAQAVTQVREDANTLGVDIASAGGTLTFHFTDRAPLYYPDPIGYVYDDLHDCGPAIKCVTHGDFNGDNLLVDQEHRLVWLIDFARTGRGSALRDFAELESVIKFELVEEKKLVLLHRFEEKLASCHDLEHTPDPDSDMPQDLQKAMLVIRDLRKLAHGIGNLSDYFASLLFHAAWMVVSEGSSPPSIGQTRPVAIRRTHALLSAAMLCDWLERGGPRPTGLVASPSLLQRTVVTGIAHLPTAPAIARVHLSNYGRQQVTATIDWQIRDLGSGSWTKLLQPDETADPEYRPVFPPSLLAQIRDRRQCQFNIRVTSSALGEEQVILDQPYDVGLLPRNVIAWTMKDAQGHEYDTSRYIAAWVTPEAAAVAQLQRPILEKHPQRQMVGYQDSGHPEWREYIVREQVRAIYNYLKHDLKMAYAHTAISFGAPGEDCQIVRLPHETLGEDRGTANCIDATVLFASLILRFSMSPIIVLVPGHALLGWQTWPGSPSGEYLETTVIDQVDFDDAMRIGTAKRDEGAQQGLVTEWRLWTLREEGIDPMPLE